MATVRSLACIAFRPEALYVHALSRWLFKNFIESVHIGLVLQTCPDFFQNFI